MPIDFPDGLGETHPPLGDEGVADRTLLGRHHLPLYVGGRFSANARGPSLASSVFISMLCRSDSKRSP